MGAPFGNQNAKNSSKNKPWSDALRLALLEDDAKWLRIIARKVRQMAADGEIQAIREIGDRLDGKPHQSISGPDGGPIEVQSVTNEELARWLAFEGAQRAIDKASSHVRVQQYDSRAAQHDHIIEALPVNKVEKA